MTFDSAALTAAVRSTVDSLRTGLDRDWSVQAGEVTWDCKATAGHIVSDLVSYAGQLAGAAWAADLDRPRRTVEVDYLPFDALPEPDATIAGVLDTIEATGWMLAAVAATAPASARGFHPYGTSDAGGFAAMGALETVVHGADIATGLGLAFAPPPEVCAAMVERLFPDAPAYDDPWQLLLWCCGRTALPGHPRREKWRWAGEPR